MPETASPSPRKTQRKKATATKKKVTKKTTAAKKTAAKKTAVKKTAVKKTAVKKSTTKKKIVRKKTASPVQPVGRVVSVEERHRMIAECAYHKGQASPVTGPDADHRHWLAAEREIDARIMKWTETGH